MVKFILENSDETLTTHSGLGLVGLLLAKTELHKRFTSLKIPDIRSMPEIQNGDVIHSYIGLLSQSKNDFEYIETFREDPFFPLALDIQEVPSCATLRQRLDQIAKTDAWKSIILEESVKVLTYFEATVTPLTIKNEKQEDVQIVPLDIDVSPFDNSKTKKEEVSRTYKGCDGYASIFAYLGQEGYIVSTELREGSTHVQNGTVQFLQESIRYSKQITHLPLLVRMDVGNDSADNIGTCVKEHAGFIINAIPAAKKQRLGWLLPNKKKNAFKSEKENASFMDLLWSNRKALIRKFAKYIKLSSEPFEEMDKFYLSLKLNLKAIRPFFLISLKKL